MAKQGNGIDERWNERRLVVRALSGQGMGMGDDDWTL